MVRRAFFREIRARAEGGSVAPAPLAARLPALIGSPGDVEARLSGLRVGVLGTGSVGSRVAAHLARLRVGGLWLADPKSLKSESVLTHDITPEQVGQKKVLAVARRCLRISSATRVRAYAGPVQELPLDALAPVDLAVMAFDNLPAEAEIGQRLLYLGKRLVHAAVQGQTLTAQVRTYGNTDGHGPCPACGYGELEWNQMSRGVLYSCEGFASAQPAPTVTAPPTRSLSSLCSMAADLALNQVIRLVLGLGKPVEDTVVDYCGYTNQIVTSRLQRNPRCRCDHTRLALATVPKPLPEYSLSTLVEDVAGLSVSGNLTVEVGEADWAAQGTCQCADPVGIERFIQAGRRRMGRCPKCRAPIATQPFYSHRRLTVSRLGTSMAVPLRQLGAAAVRWVLLRDPDQERGALIRNANADQEQP